MANSATRGPSQVQGWGAQPLSAGSTTAQVEQGPRV